MCQQQMPTYHLQQSQMSQHNINDKICPLSPCWSSVVLPVVPGAFTTCLWFRCPQLGAHWGQGVTSCSQNRAITWFSVLSLSMPPVAELQLSASSGWLSGVVVFQHLETQFGDHCYSHCWNGHLILPFSIRKEKDEAIARFSITMWCWEPVCNILPTRLPEALNIYYVGLCIGLCMGS